ncbi:hypothetical protein PR048_015195 [Dryococelus australis]|uniref:Uncharacterized protein n=1 Tax=Dryococelus australis TaxID=614101 RepID=A0ABQ9HG99_9NEOP|nr:hypothetical protein PR048_015195 [Dryococelus australis]
MSSIVWFLSWALPSSDVGTVVENDTGVMEYCLGISDRSMPAQVSRPSRESASLITIMYGRRVICSLNDVETFRLLKATREYKLSSASLRPVKPKRNWLPPFALECIDFLYQASPLLISVVINEAETGPISEVITFAEGRGGVVVRLLASHQGGEFSGPGAVASGPSHGGNMSDNAVGRQVFSGISRIPRPCIPARLHTHLALRSSALKNSSVLPSRAGTTANWLPPAEVRHFQTVDHVKLLSNDHLPSRPPNHQRRRWLRCSGSLFDLGPGVPLLLIGSVRVSEVNDRSYVIAAGERAAYQLHRAGRQGNLCSGAFS